MLRNTFYVAKYLYRYSEKSLTEFDHRF